MKKNFSLNTNSLWRGHLPVTALECSQFSGLFWGTPLSTFLFLRSVLQGSLQKQLESIPLEPVVLKAEEEKVSHSQVENVDREGIPMHVEAQKPQHHGISCHPNQGKDEEKKTHSLVHNDTIQKVSVDASIWCCDGSLPGWDADILV